MNGLRSQKGRKKLVLWLEGIVAKIADKGMGFGVGNIK